MFNLYFLEESSGGDTETSLGDSLSSKGSDTTTTELVVDELGDDNGVFVD